MRQSEDKMGDLMALLRRSEGSAIVYTRSRGGTRDTALALQAAGIPALYYHAGLPPPTRVRGKKLGNKTAPA